MISILFVSLENTCRSLIAEAVFLDLVQKEGLIEQITIDSAGTRQWHAGKGVDEEAIKFLTRKGIPTNQLSPRQLERTDLEHFNYIIGLDQQVFEDVQKLTRAASNDPEYLLLLELTDTEMVNVPKTHISGDSKEVYDLIYEGCSALLTKIKKTILLEES